MRLSIFLPIAFTSYVVSAADVFNITSCYCYEHFDPPGPRPPFTDNGYYYGFSYYNAHLDRTYSFNVSKHIHDDEVKAIEQETPQPRLRKTCQQFENEGQQAELCYYRKKTSRGRFTFNGHKRKLPFQNYVDAQFGYLASIDKCEVICPQEMGLKQQHISKSAFISYDTKEICKDDSAGHCEDP